ncbi:MAG: Mth938-like domain-containing protein, partial [Nitrosomonadales bacterium]|nr:Mth938-like domain-containing protein [Nitrosomonadales bacterium]
ASDFESLTVEHFEKIAELKPEVVLLGTGNKHRFIHPRLTAPLTALGISVECMDTAAACRTYNILMAEGRHVAAALINRNVSVSQLL